MPIHYYSGLFMEMTNLITKRGMWFWLLLLFLGATTQKGLAVTFGSVLTALLAVLREPFRIQR